MTHVTLQGSQGWVVELGHEMDVRAEDLCVNGESIQNGLFFGPGIPSPRFILGRKFFGVDQKY